MSNCLVHSIKWLCNTIIVEVQMLQNREIMNDVSTYLKINVFIHHIHVCSRSYKYSDPLSLNINLPKTCTIDLILNIYFCLSFSVIAHHLNIKINASLLPVQNWKMRVLPFCFKQKTCFTP